MSTYTPGTWTQREWSCHAKTTVIVEKPSGTQVIAECSLGPIAEREANAQLMAAAPELLEELKVTAQRYHENSYLWVHDEHENSKRFEECAAEECLRRQALIQKAEGAQ
jgi:hypothetical protein